MTSIITKLLRQFSIFKSIDNSMWKLKCYVSHDVKHFQVCMEFLADRHLLTANLQCKSSFSPCKPPNGVFLNSYKMSQTWGTNHVNLLHGAFHLLTITVWGNKLCSEEVRCSANYLCFAFFLLYELWVFFRGLIITRRATLMGCVVFKSVKMWDFF